MKSTCLLEREAVKSDRGLPTNWMEHNAYIRPRKPKLTAVGIRCADHATPSIR
jgi:hypothetical protein